MKGGGGVGKSSCLTICICMYDDVKMLVASCGEVVLMMVAAVAWIEEC